MRPLFLMPLLGVWSARGVGASRRRERRQQTLSKYCTSEGGKIVPCDECERVCIPFANGVGDAGRSLNGIQRDTELPPGANPTAPTNAQPSASDVVSVQTAGPADIANESAVSSSKSNHSNSKPNTGAIVGGVVGGVAVLALMTFAIFWFVLRRKPKDRDVDHRTESALALEKLGTDSPESPSDSTPSAYPAPIDTSLPLPPPPPPPPPPASTKPLPPVEEPEQRNFQSLSNQEREQLLPPLPAPQRQLSQRKPVPVTAQPTPTPAPPPPPVEPAEILSREVDSDGVSVRSFDMEREARDREAARQAVPRLPIYTKPTSSGDNLGLPGQAL